MIKRRVNASSARAAGYFIHEEDATRSSLMSWRYLFFGFKGSASWHDCNAVLDPCAASAQIDRDIPITRRWYGYSRGQSSIMAAVVIVPALLISIPPKIYIIHKHDVAFMGAVNDDEIPSVQILAPVQKIQCGPPMAPSVSEASRKAIISPK